MASTLGPKGWEINQYQTRASLELTSFFFALFFSSHLHLLIGRRTWASVHLAVFSVIASTACPPVALVVAHWGDHERKWRLRYFCAFVYCVIHWRWKRSPLTPACEKVLMLSRGSLWDLLHLLSRILFNLDHHLFHESSSLIQQQ